MVEETVESIKTTDIKPEIPQPDGTVIVLQRHEEYIRKAKDNPRRGSLTDEGAMRARNQAETFLNSVFGGLSPEEMDNVDILVVASDTRAGKGQRSMETAAKVLDACNSVFDRNHIDKNHILNNKGKGGVRPIKQLREPRIFDESPDFVDFMIEKYGPPGTDFFKAFEQDVEEVTRKKMGAEGPLEIADRLKKYTEVLKQFAKRYHEKNPGRRLLVWATTHYDTISPFVKRDVLKMSDQETKATYLDVDYGGGITINIDPHGNGKTSIGGNEYSLN
jgi:hypothetical protein